jgi:hypothetical protein
VNDDYDDDDDDAAAGGGGDKHASEFRLSIPTG